jgi:GT2 family glycosyltransferase
VTISSVCVVVLAWGAEPLLEECVRSALESDHTDIRVIVVDNGANPDAVSSVMGLDRVQVIVPGENLGFAGGCNFGAAAAAAEVLVFLNSDARLAADTARILAQTLDADATVGLAMGSVRLWDEPHLMNTSGNPWHFLGFVWAGGFKEPVADHAVDTEVACASGATMAIRRRDWEDLGGFDPAYFAYHEDAELSLRVWQRGRRVLHVAGAASYHRYEFSRNQRKQFLLERNRLLTLMTHYEARTLILLAPMLVGAELGVMLLAAKQGWLGQKAAGYRWLARNWRHIVQRRREVQSARTVPDWQLAPLFSAALEPAVLGQLPGLGLVNAAGAAYWRAVRRALSVGPTVRPAKDRHRTR